VLQYYSAATEHHRAWYRAWHAYAIMNYQAVLFYKSAVTDAQQASGEDAASVDNNLKEMVRESTKLGARSLHFSIRPPVSFFLMFESGLHNTQQQWAHGTPGLG
jgi:hypothetical protein